MLLVDFADLDFLRNFKTSDLVCKDEGGISWLKNPYVYSGRFEAVGSFHLDSSRPTARKTENALSNRSGIVGSLKLSVQSLSTWSNQSSKSQVFNMQSSSRSRICDSYYWYSSRLIIVSGISAIAISPPGFEMPIELKKIFDEYFIAIK